MRSFATALPRQSARRLTSLSLVPASRLLVLLLAFSSPVLPVKSRILSCSLWRAVTCLVLSNR